MGFSNVNIGFDQFGSRKSSRFDFSCDSFFTSNFGQIVPSYFKEIIGGSQINASKKTLVRTSPLAVPTEGRISAKDYWCFVSLPHLFQPYEALKANLDFNFVNGSSVPTSLPYASYLDILAGMISRSDVPVEYSERLDTICVYKQILQSGSWIYAKCDETDAEPILEAICPSNGVLGYLLPGQRIFFSSGDESESNREFDVTTEGFLNVYRQNSSYPVSFDLQRDFTFNSENYRICIKYGTIRKLAMSYLIGLGYPYTPSDKNVNILPIVSFYRAWFDIFGIQRDRSYTDTACSKLERYFNSYPLSYLLSSGDWKTTLYSFLKEFIDDVCYTLSPDYYTSQLRNNADNQNQSSLDWSFNTSSTVPGFNVKSNEGLGSYIEQSNYQVGLGEILAHKMLRFVNVNTVVGKKIESYIHSHYPNVKSESKESYLIGTNITPFGTEAIWSTGAPDEGLGEYAGRSVGSGSSGQIQFEAKQDGYFFCFSVVVPKPGYYSGCDPTINHLKRFDLYTPDFDSTGLVPTTRDEVVNDYLIIPEDIQSSANSVVSLRPRYQEFKVKNNQINGEFRYGSYRDTMSAYFLDRMFFTFPTITEGFRKIHPLYDLFNLNRIFQYTDNDSDHFKVFNTFDVFVNSPMIPCEDSAINTQQQGINNIARS